MDNRIVVAVRIRPTLEKERFETVCARKSDDGQTLTIKCDETVAGFSEPTAFQFDMVFDYADDQRTVYEECAQELIDFGLEGSNATIFTYGQTGSGKTFTILGEVSQDGSISPKSGIFLRVFEDLFTYKASVANRLHVVIALSAIELYVEDVMDLLSNKKKIKLRETPEETMMPGMCTVEVHTLAEVVAQFNIANSFRSVTATRMNDVSSRSHALFFIDLYQIPTTSMAATPSLQSLVDGNGMLINKGIPGLVKSRVALVDLAGSERVKRSGVEGQGMIEAQAINKSLSTLGTVINAMYLENAHIPFRESKLTKMLKPSFMDRASRLLLIGQVSPPQTSAQESLGTLRFCDRVKGLKAGKVAAFMDPEEEERYLSSLRTNEELLADLRIASVLHYYSPQRPKFFAQLKGVPASQERDAIVASLKIDAPHVAARKEEEMRQKMEQKCSLERDKMIEDFVVKMNGMIEQYEALAEESKKEKKSGKKLKEQQDAELEGATMDAKRAKKQRLKSGERVAELTTEITAAKETMQGLTQQEEQIMKELRAMNSFDDDGDAAGEDPNKPTSAEGRKLLQNHVVVEEFFNNMSDLSRLHAQYAERLGLSSHVRANVRQAKISTSDILLDSTMVYDIIDFMIDRAVDIAEGEIDPTVPYSWYDINGLSRQLKDSEAWYPPLRVTPQDYADEPCEVEEFHKRTFLSSDESDDENHHHYSNAQQMFQRAAGTSNAADTAWLNDEDGGKSNAANNNGNDDGSPGSPGSPKRGDGADGDARTNQAQERRRKSKARQPGEEGAGDGGDNASGPASPTAGAEGEKSAGNGKPAAAQKKKPAEEDDRAYLMKIYDSPTLVNDVLKFLRSGSVMTKHGRSGKPHRRVFWISFAKSKYELLWMEPNKKDSDRSSITLADVSYVSLGAFSKVFQRHPISESDPSFFLSITLGLKNGSRTVDIVADTLPDFEAWVIGLSNIVGVDPVWGGKLNVATLPQFQDLTFFESNLCEAWFIRPATYLDAKNRITVIAERVRDVLNKCGNDTAKAFKLTGGIHPPGINDKGAVYITKGELRYLTAKVNLDIIRVSKLWSMFEQLQLVYDPKFLPPTAFGITKRS